MGKHTGQQREKRKKKGQPMSNTNVVAIDTCKSNSPSKRHARMTDSEIEEYLICAAGGMGEKYVAGEKLSSKLAELIDRINRLRNIHSTPEIAVQQELLPIAIPPSQKPMNNRLTPESLDAKILDYLFNQKDKIGNFIPCGRSDIISGIRYTKSAQDITNRLGNLVRSDKIVMIGSRKGAKYYPVSEV
jgi:hypothetical protein